MNDEAYHDLFSYNDISIFPQNVQKERCRKVKEHEWGNMVCVHLGDNLD